MKTKQKTKSLNKSTRVIPIRVSIEQLEALKSLPEGVSVSALARTLFALYLEGSLPTSFLERIYDEVARTNLAVKAKQQSFTAARRAEKGTHDREQQPERAILNTATLRERIMLSFGERSSTESSTGDSM